VLRWAAADTAAVWKACTKKLSAISCQLSVGSKAPLARAGLFIWARVPARIWNIPDFFSGESATCPAADLQFAVGQCLEGIASGYWTLSVKQPSGLSATRVRVPCPPKVTRHNLNLLDKGCGRAMLEVTDSA
jgi:hypothetical protein